MRDLFARECREGLGTLSGVGSGIAAAIARIGETPAELSRESGWSAPALIHSSAKRD